MTSRERMLKAFAFSGPDKIPVVYHPSPAGLYVHGQKLLDLFNAYPPDNPVCFDALPCPPADAVDASGRYHEIRTDEWGTEWEHLIYGVWGHPRRYPFGSWEEASAYTFPPFSCPDRAEVEAQRATHLVFSGMISLLERLQALRPIDEVLMDILVEDPALISFLDRMEAYWQDGIAALLETGVDVVMFGDDWGTQQAPILPPQAFRNLFLPRYERLMAPIHKAGHKVFFHSCGCLGEILDALIGLGIDGLWPQLGFFESDPRLFEKCAQNKVTLYLHPDRQYLVPRGTPAEIERTIANHAERYHALGGGGIFYVEVENDAPFENIQALVEAIDKWR